MLGKGLVVCSSHDRSTWLRDGDQKEGLRYRRLLIFSIALDTEELLDGPRARAFLTEATLTLALIDSSASREILIWLRGTPWATSRAQCLSESCKIFAMMQLELNPCFFSIFKTLSTPSYFPSREVASKSNPQSIKSFSKGFFCKTTTLSTSGKDLKVKTFSSVFKSEGESWSSRTATVKLIFLNADFMSVIVVRCPA